MPGGKKKPFINKKTAVSFHLVHRSQRDPLQADDDAPSRVLVPASDQLDDAEQDKRQEEQRKFGVFYDDDYDYMQHLYDLGEVRSVNVAHVFDDVQILDDDISITITTKSTLQLPSSVFPSTTETTVGLLNKAVPVRGPQPDWDPDIVAAMDDDFNMDDPENVLEDDFISQANADDTDGDSSSEDDGSISSGDLGIRGSDCDLFDEADEYGERMFLEEETKSRFTNYSMTSSVMRRNDGLTLLDDRFEKLFEDYDDSEIGPLDHEDIDGLLTQDDPLMQQVINDFETKMKKEEEEGVVGGLGNVSHAIDSGAESDDSLTHIVIETADKQWDCESILSTYSNLYNHPRLIEEPSKKKIDLTSRLGIPRDALPTTGLTRKQIEKEMRECRRADRASTYRPEGETPEERRNRKQAIKSERKERRVEKKSNQLAFKEEAQRQQKQRINVMQNTQGAKIT